MKCSERSCPFGADPGNPLCRFHRMTFTYGLTLEDTANPVPDAIKCDRDNSGFKLSARSRIIPAWERSMNRHASKIKVASQLIASGSLIASVIPMMSDMADSYRHDLFTRLEPAQLLFQQARLPHGVFCIICGSDSLCPKIYSGGRVSWQCRRCRGGTSILGQTFFSESKRTANEWLYSAWELYGGFRWGTLERIRKHLDVSEATTLRMKGKLLKAASAGGIDLGFEKLDIRRFERKEIARFQGRGETRQCCVCSCSIQVGQFYRRMPSEGDWVHENCLQLKLVKL